MRPAYVPQVPRTNDLHDDADMVSVTIRLSSRELQLLRRAAPSLKRYGIVARVAIRRYLERLTPGVFDDNAQLRFVVCPPIGAQVYDPLRGLSEPERCKVLERRLARSMFGKRGGE